MSHQPVKANLRLGGKNLKSAVIPRHLARSPGGLKVGRLTLGAMNPTKDGRTGKGL